jgi:phosphoglycolate phosphatase
MDSMPVMHRRFDLVVFDWDGTLMDSATAIARSLQSACRDLDFPVPGEEQARYVIGLGLDDAMSHILPDLDPLHYARVRERYRVHFLANDAGTALFPGAAETVAALHEAGFLLGVATGKSRRGLDRALDATGLRSYFHATRCADEASSKPHPAMLLQLMGELDVASERTLMIGDTTHDMGMARAAGVARLAAAYGAHAKETLLEYEPLACVGNFDELRLWLAQNA